MERKSSNKAILDMAAAARESRTLQYEGANKRDDLNCDHSRDETLARQRRKAEKDDEDGGEDPRMG